MGRFDGGERVRFIKKLSFVRHDGSVVVLAEEDATGTVLGTFYESSTPLLTLVALDSPEESRYAKVEVPEDYLEPE